MPIRTKKSAGYSPGTTVKFISTGGGGEINMPAATTAAPEEPVYAVFQNGVGKHQIIRFQNGVFTTTSMILDPAGNPTSQAGVHGATNRLGVGVLGGSYWGGDYEKACVWLVEGSDGICSLPMILEEIPPFTKDYSFVWKVFARTASELIVVSYAKQTGDEGEIVQTWKIDLLASSYTLLDQSPSEYAYEGAFVSQSGDIFLYGRTFGVRGHYDAFINKLSIADDAYTSITFTIPAGAGSSEVDFMTQLPNGNLIALGLYDAAEGPFTSMLWEFDASGTELRYYESYPPPANKGWVGAIPVNVDTLVALSETNLYPGGLLHLIEKGKDPPWWSSLVELSNSFFQYNRGLGQSQYATRFDGNYVFIKPQVGETHGYYFQRLDAIGQSIETTTAGTANVFSASDNQQQMMMPDGGVALFGWDTNVGSLLSIAYVSPTENTTVYAVSPYAYFGDGFYNPEIVTWRPGPDLGGRPYT